MTETVKEIDCKDVQIKLAWLRDQVDIACMYSSGEDYTENDLQSFSAIARDVYDMYSDLQKRTDVLNRQILKRIQTNQQWTGEDL